MTEHVFKQALEAAEKELENLDWEAERIEQRRSQLQQTIASLKTLMNVAPDDEARTLTDTIRTVVKASNGYISAADVLKGAISMGAKFGGKNAIASVVTILSRLHRDGELERDTSVAAGGYRWKRMTFGQRIATRQPRIAHRVVADVPNPHGKTLAEMLKEPTKK